jgi:hypothetical protein
MTRAAVGSSILTLKSSHGRSARANEVSQLNSAMNPRDGGLPSSAKGQADMRHALIRVTNVGFLSGARPGRDINFSD